MWEKAAQSSHFYSQMCESAVKKCFLWRSKLITFMNLLRGWMPLWKSELSVCLLLIIQYHDRCRNEHFGTITHKFLTLFILSCNSVMSAVNNYAWAFFNWGVLESWKNSHITLMYTQHIISFIFSQYKHSEASVWTRDIINYQLPLSIKLFILNYI